MKLRLAVGAALLLFASCVASAAQITQAQCIADTGAPSILLSSGIGIVVNGSTATYTDNTSIVDGATYAYVVDAIDWAGFTCSNVVLNVVIPATGTHTVALSWTTSTTPGATYGVFRASPPLNPSGLAVVVN
jgi:hypothetical protein